MAVNYSSDRTSERMLRPSPTTGARRSRSGPTCVSKAVMSRAYLEEVHSAFGRLDVWSTTPIFRFGAFAEDCHRRELFTCLSNINVLGAMLTVQEAASSGSGPTVSIINLSSTGSHPVAGPCCTLPRKAPSKHRPGDWRVELAPRDTRSTPSSAGTQERDSNAAAGTLRCVMLPRLRRTLLKGLVA